MHFDVIIEIEIAASWEEDLEVFVSIAIVSFKGRGGRTVYVTAILLDVLANNKNPL